VRVTFLRRLFASLLKEQGPMDPNDALIQHELEMCSTQAQVVICEAGGICKFLLQSLQFSVVDGYICLASDSGKARQLARSRRQLNMQQPQLRTNPSLHMSASTGVIQPNTIASTPAPIMPPPSAYRSLADMDISSSSRIIPGLSQQSGFEPSNVPAFLSQPSSTQRMFQPDTNSSSVLQTAVHHTNNNYNDNGSKRVNADNTYDSWTTVAKVNKSSSGIRNPDNSNSGAIGDLDDFMEPFMSENCGTGVGALTLNEATVSTVMNENADYKFSLGSEASDESSAHDLSSDGGSEDEEDIHGDLDSFDTEVAETCAAHAELSVALSVTAPEFIPQSYAANLPSLITSLGTSSPKTTTSNQASCDSRPSSRAAVMSERQVQTDVSWEYELQQLKDSHSLELTQLQQQLSHYKTQLQVSLSLL